MTSRRYKAILLSLMFVWVLAVGFAIGATVALFVNLSVIHGGMAAF
jgi:hypothetical protein